jgi:hypothetical protein
LQHLDNSAEQFEKSFHENIRAYMEMRNAQWVDIMMMPYQFFIDDLKWKIDLEDTKRKQMESLQKMSGDKAMNALQQRNKKQKLGG